MIAVQKPSPFRDLRRRLMKNKANNPKFEDNYRIGELLCKGSQGSVYKAYHVLYPDRKLAVKIIDRKNLNKKQEEQILREVSIMRELQDIESINRVVDFFAPSKKFYIVQELACGGDVFDRVVRQGAYSEKDARVLMANLLRAVEEFHSRNIAHRDLKPENLLLPRSNDKTTIRVADWGFAQHNTNKKMTQKCGTPNFCAPEIIAGKPYDERADLWSVGCILYLILSNRPAFFIGKNNDAEEMFQKIEHGDYKFYDKKHTLSKEAKECIRGLLTADPEKRWTAKQVLACDWMQGCGMEHEGRIAETVMPTMAQ